MTEIRHNMTGSYSAQTAERPNPAERVQALREQALATETDTFQTIRSSKKSNIHFGYHMNSAHSDKNETLANGQKAHVDIAHVDHNIPDPK